MNKKYLVLFIILIFVSLVYFFTNRAKPIKNFPPKNNVIVAFGDSLIEGVGSTDNNDFISLLSKKINKPIINLGKSGDTTTQGLMRLSEVSNLNPGTVIILLGGNDYLKKVSESETFSNLKEIITKLQNEGILVILLGVRGGLLSDKFESSFEELADEKNVVYVPNVLDGLILNSQYMSDTVHPNNLGYSIIAEKVFKIAKNYLIFQ